VQGKHVAHAVSALRLVRTALVSLPRAQLAVAQARADALRASAAAVALYQPRSPAEVETNIERNELGADTLAEIEARLTAVQAAGADADRSETDALYLKLKALIYLHPDTAAALGASLVSDNAATPRFRLVAGALGAVGSPEAQTALAAAIRARPTDWPTLSAVTPELCTLPSPTEDAEGAVRSLIPSADSNTAAMAWLCLGGMARGLAQSAPPRSAAIVAELTQGLEASPDENAKALLLQAIGNANAAAAMPAVSPYASSASPVLRAAAMDAMRGIPLPAVDGALRQALAGDGDAKVRREAAFALGFRPPDPADFAAEKTALAADQDAQVRAALVGDLAKLTGPFPEARALIQSAADNDPSEDVRKAAASLLQMLGDPR
jgi:hypothetical protein